MSGKIQIKKWTREKCLELIEAVKTRGSAKVAKEEGYKDGNSLMRNLRSYSKRFGLLDEYKQMMNIRPHGNSKWTREKCLEVIEAVKNRGSTEVAKEEGYKNVESFMGNLKSYSEKFGVGDIYSETIGKEIKWTRERCLELIEAVRTRGSTEVAKEEGYKNVGSLMGNLKSYSEKFGVGDIYSETIGRKLKWTREKCLEVIEAVEDQGFDAVARERNFKDAHSLMCNLKDYSKRFGLLDDYNKMMNTQRKDKSAKWTREKCLEVIEAVEDQGFNEVAKNLGYTHKSSLRRGLRCASIRFGLLSEYESLLNKNGSSSDEK